MLSRPFSTFLAVMFGALRERWTHSRLRGDGGYSTETVLVTALLVALAIAAVAVITAKVMDKANSINLG